MVVTTEKHPFYVQGRGWVWAAELKPGDLLLGHQGEPRAVESVALTGRVETLYNLRVAFDRTYFVGSPSWGFSLWVHNTYILRTNASGLREVGVLDEAGNFIPKASVRPGTSTAEAERLVALMNQADKTKGLSYVLESTPSSWRKHGARLYADLKNVFRLEIDFAAKDVNVAKRVAAEYEKRIESGILKYKGFVTDIHDSFFVYEYGGNLYLFGEKGNLISRLAPGSEGRALRRILDLLGQI